MNAKPPFPNPAKLLTDAVATRSRSRRRSLEDMVAVEPLVAALRRNDLNSAMQLEDRLISSLRPPKRNSRKLHASHIAEVAESIRRYGNRVPILVTRDGRVIDGLVRLEAMRLLGIDVIPCIIVDDMSDSDIQALRASLNRIAEKGDWDLEILCDLLKEMRFEERFVLPGFSAPEIDAVLNIGEPAFDSVANDCPPLGVQAPISLPGDIWQCKGHRIFCADACVADNYRQLFDGAPAARVIITDPPFGCKIDGHVSGKGGIRHREFIDGTSDLTSEQLAALLERFLRSATSYLHQGALTYVFMDSRGLQTLLNVGAAVGLRLLTMIVWDKGRGGMGGLYRSAHELVALFKCGSEPHLDRVNLGKHGRDRTNIWSYPGATTPGSSARKALDDHPTPKSVEMIADAILDTAELGEIILDPFLGSGTTLIAAEKTGRLAYGFELDPLYVDVIIRRFEKFAGVDAIHAASGNTFKQMEAERCKAASSTDTTSDTPNDPSVMESSHEHQ